MLVYLPIILIYKSIINNLVRFYAASIYLNMAKMSLRWLVMAQVVGCFIVCYYARLNRSLISN